jgi:hypothetical protein
MIDMIALDTAMKAKDSETGVDKDISWEPNRPSFCDQSEEIILTALYTAHF